MDSNEVSYCFSLNRRTASENTFKLFLELNKQKNCKLVLKRLITISTKMNFLKTLKSQTNEKINIFFVVFLTLIEEFVYEKLLLVMGFIYKTNLWSREFYS
ncbi:hypothetical protein BpHYR1_001042 [Brachionus plicatilis]|uniref:Uncharacterized protein n=1 Tax=Brachionus plicatilis TaxID=10195 RepID=A0A3M7QDT1_BRAPC|nr:hypothetical protein BpHYR1_001042 [Brachionus plicatilis]